MPRNAKSAAPMTFPVYRDSCRAALSRDLADAKALTGVDDGTRRYLMLYAEACYVAKLTGYRRWLHQFLYAQGETSGEKRDSLFKAHYGKDFTLKEADVAATLNLFHSPEAVAVLNDARSTDAYARANGLELSPLGKWCTEIKRVIDVKERIGKMQAVSDEEIAALPEAMQTFARADNEKLKAALNQTTKKWEKIRTYGGKLTENVVQAIARDILGNVIIRAEESGLHIVFHIHDEIVVEAEAGQTLADVEAIFSKQISWCRDLPLKGAGYTTPYYLKD